MCLKRTIKAKKNTSPPLTTTNTEVKADRTKHAYDIIKQFAKMSISIAMRFYCQYSSTSYLLLEFLYCTSTDPTGTIQPSRVHKITLKPDSVCQETTQRLPCCLVRTDLRSATLSLRDSSATFDTVKQLIVLSTLLI